MLKTRFTCGSCNSCPKDTHCNENTRECEPCDKTCKTCVGTSNTCTFPCALDKFWHNFKCLDECPTGFFSCFLNF